MWTAVTEKGEGQGQGQGRGQGWVPSAGHWIRRTLSGAMRSSWIEVQQAVVRSDHVNIPTNTAWPRLRVSAGVNFRATAMLMRSWLSRLRRTKRSRAEYS